jgi:hypothetical protein
MKTQIKDVRQIRLPGARGPADEDMGVAALEADAKLL